MELYFVAKWQKYLQQKKIAACELYILFVR
jgi:hypothetical protein